MKNDQIPRLPDKGSNSGAQAEPISPAQIEMALKEAEALKAWWAKVEAGKASTKRFELLAESAIAKPIWGFFADVSVLGKTVPVMGHVGDFFFDRLSAPPHQKNRDVEWMSEQVSEFALHYWMRSLASISCQPYPELNQIALPPYLQAFSWRPPPEVEVFGEEAFQSHFKLRTTGEVARFPRAQRSAIVDLRKLETDYEWVTIDIPIFDFNMDMGLADTDLPHLALPIKATLHSATNANLTTDERNPKPGILGRFGPGLGILKMSDTGVWVDKSGGIRPGVKQHYLQVDASGEIRAKTLTIMRRPEKIANALHHLLQWGFTTTDMLTLGISTKALTPVLKGLDRFFKRNVHANSAGQAMRLSKGLGISTEQIEKEILLKDAILLQRTILHSRHIWMMVADWQDHSAIPEWIKRGDRKPAHRSEKRKA